MAKRQHHMSTWRVLAVLVPVALMWVILSSIGISNYIQAIPKRYTKFVRATVKTGMVDSRSRHTDSGNEVYDKPQTLDEIVLRKPGVLHILYGTEAAANAGSQKESERNLQNLGQFLLRRPGVLHILYKNNQFCSASEWYILLVFYFIVFFFNSDVTIPYKNS